MVTRIMAVGFRDIREPLIPSSRRIRWHTSGMTPAVARRLLYGIVVACLAVTGGTVLLRPAPPRVIGPQYQAPLPRGIPEIHAISGSVRIVTIPIDGASSQIDHVEITVPVHGLPGQVGASP